MEPYTSGSSDRPPANDELVRRLNADGLATGHGRPFDVKAVQWIRHAYNIPAPAPYAGGEISVAGATLTDGQATSSAVLQALSDMLSASSPNPARPGIERSRFDCERQGCSGHGVGDS